MTPTRKKDHWVLAKDFKELIAPYYQQGTAGRTPNPPRLNGHALPKKDNDVILHLHQRRFVSLSVAERILANADLSPQMADEIRFQD